MMKLIVQTMLIVAPIYVIQLLIHASIKELVLHVIHIKNVYHIYAITEFALVKTMVLFVITIIITTIMFVAHFIVHLLVFALVTASEDIAYPM